MKFKSIIAAILCAAIGAAPAIAADETFVNLTPRPKSMTLGQGSYTLPQGFKVSTAGLDSEMAAEASRFVEAVNAATALGAATTDGAAADVTIAKSPSVAPEGYNLDITPAGVTIEASTPCGLYFAFQTIKKILPPNVMAGKPAESEAAYTLPVATINDEPRFEYRGFMLDVCRHFFTVDEIKRMLDVMSYYKMNAFHWHLTEDQGWRIEVPAWPRLTTVGATAPNCRFTDHLAKTQYWTNRPYGPYFYTIDEMKDVVAYAAERHITVIPEVELPGHASAVCAAYPELSCDPEGMHSVWSDGGVSADVLNVADPKVLQFVKDVIDVLAEVFPAETIHIGGDECPTSKWQTNALCQAKVEELGFTGNNADQKFRKLQNWFTKQVSDYARSKGRTIGCWNEAITSGGADLSLMKESQATIWCWTGPDNAVNVGTNNGLRVVYTPYSSGDNKRYDGTPSTGTKGAFYINRKQDPDDAPANGNTWDTVDKTYNTHPFTDNALSGHPELCYGVQGTFWTERVSDSKYLEWLALPRLIAIAEIGWTPQELKDFNHFIARVKADTRLLDLGGYSYSPYFLEDAITPGTSKPGIPEMAPLSAGKTYEFINVTPGFEGIRLADCLEGNNLNASPSAWDNTIWTVSDVTVNPDNSHSIKLTNLATGQSVASADAYAQNHGRLIRMGATAAAITAKANPGSESFTLEITPGSPFWPNLADALYNPGCVSSGIVNENDGEAANFSRMMGADWKAVEITPMTFVCVDTEGRELFRGTRGVNAAETELNGPEIRNHTQRSATVDGTTVNCVYERTGVTVTISSRLENGALLGVEQTTVAVGTPVTVGTPDHGEFFTLASSSLTGEPTFTPDGDVDIEFVYTTEAHLGVKAPGSAVTQITAGNVYLIRDSHAERHAWRYANASRKVAGSNRIEGTDPSFVWTFEPTGEGKHAIANCGAGLYVQNVKLNEQGSLGTRARDFILTYSAPAWTIRNASNELAWDGQGNLNMVGWNAPGHPHEIYSFYALPYFSVTVKMVDTDGKQLTRETSEWVEAGKAYVLTVPERPGYVVKSIAGNEGIDAVKADTEITVTYANDVEGAIADITANCAKSTIHDLSGRRLSHISRAGVYIVNGVKTLVH